MIEDGSMEGDPKSK